MEKVDHEIIVTEVLANRVDQTDWQPGGRWGWAVPNPPPIGVRRPIKPIVHDLSRYEMAGKPRVSFRGLWWFGPCVVAVLAAALSLSLSLARGLM